MKTSISTFRFALLAAALAFSPLTAVVHAQSNPNLKVHVPFAFHAGSRTLPAGVYTVSQVAPQMLSINGPKSDGTTTSQTESPAGKVNAPSKLVFTRYGSEYFLREVWRTGNLDHTVCYKTKAEINAQRAVQSKIAAVNPPASTVEVSSANASR